MDRVKDFFGEQPTYFNTLTMQADDVSDIMKHWHTINKRIAYYYPHLKIFWVKELTKRGVRHLHFLTTRALDGAWLSRSWLEITGTSYIVQAGTSWAEVRNPAGYMLKYMTKAHEAIQLYEKGERMYGFLGAKAPARQLLGFEHEPLDFQLDQHWNVQSKYWMDFYNKLQIAYGQPFIEYMEYQTLNAFKRMDVDREKLNFYSPNANVMFTKVKLAEVIS